MKRRKFMKIAGLMGTASAFSASVIAKPITCFQKKEVYEWRIYTLINNKNLFDEFLKNTLIPTYNRKKIKVGAFKPNQKPDEKNELRHVLFIYPDMESYMRIQKEIWEDQTFIQDSKAYFENTAGSPVYSNFETYLSEAFDKIPLHRIPDSNRTIFELRIYQSPNEDANKRKVKMFNVDEIDIFDKTGIHSVLYGNILAGPCMPSLMYLTWYQDEAARLKAWDQFRSHPDWKRISGLPEYANTATNNQKILLDPLPYSQL